MNPASFSLPPTGLSVAGLRLGLVGWVLLAMPVVAKTYYVSTSAGSDSNTTTQAQALASPWKTIQKAATNMLAGDTCLIQSGTYRETVTVPASGTAAAPIIFRADAGQAVTLSGAESITGWTQESPNVYYAPMSWTLSARNQVFQAGAMKPEARWPNAGATYPFQNSAIYPSPDWSYVSTTGMTGSNSWITDSNLPVRADGYWANGIIHIMAGAGWYIQDATVTGYTAATKNLATTYTGTGSAYGVIATNEYYLSGIKGEMDSPGEWYYDALNARIYFFSASAPANVEAKKRDYGFNLTGRSYVNLDGLGFFGCTIQTGGATANCTLDGLTMQYLGHSRNRDSSICGLNLYDGFVLRNSRLGFDSRYIIQLRGSNVRVINNDLHDSGYAPVDELLNTSSTTPVGNLISHNSIHDSGRGLISFIGRSTILEYNDLYNGIKMATDGGIMHTNGPADGTIIRYNLMHDALGAAHHTGNSVQGFYLDSKNSGYMVHHNIIWNINGHAFQFNNTQNSIMVFNNTCWNTTQGSLATAFAPDAVSSDPNTPEASSGTYLFNNLFNGSPGTQNTWPQCKFRNNYYTDPGFINPPGNFQLRSTSAAIDHGLVIPAVTDGYVGNMPDMGALEYGKADWTGTCGYKASAPAPDPVYDNSGMIFGSRVRNGSFENGVLAPDWTATPPGNASLLNANSWTDSRVRMGNYSLVIGGTGARVQQTLTGLLPNHRYGLYVGMKGTDPAQILSFGVKNFGFPELQGTVTADANWYVNNLTFITGANSTTADIYVNAVIPSGVSTPVYVDDCCVQLNQAPEDRGSSLAPVIYYPFSETGGSVVGDQGTSGLNGTFYGAMTGANANGWVPGKLGNAINLNGVDGYVMTPPVATPQELTVACWVKSKAATWNDYACFFAKRPSFFLTGVAGTNQVRTDVFLAGSATIPRIVWTPATGFDIMQWHHYAEVIKPLSGMVYLYVDGVLVGTSGFAAAAVAPDDAGSYYIGKDDYTGRFMNGYIDDARIYNYDVTGPGILQIMKVDVSKILHLKLDDGPGATRAADSSGLGAIATLNSVAPADWSSAGKINGALHFNGTSSYIACAGISTPAELTVSGWVKSDTSTWNDDGCFFAKRPSFILAGVAGTAQVRSEVYMAGTPATQSLIWTPPGGFDITQWHHYAEVIAPSSGYVTLYVDGIMVATAGFSPAPIAPDDNGNIDIARDPVAGRYLRASIDDVRVYSRALSANDLIELFFESNLPQYVEGYQSTLLMAPLVTLAGSNPLIFEAAGTYADPGATASDSLDGVLVPQVISSTVVASQPGTYSVTWAATNSSALTGTATRAVTVVDTTPPTITLSANITIDATSVRGAVCSFTTSAMDYVSGPAATTSIPASGSLFPIGVTTVTTTASDGANNTASRTFTVTVIPSGLYPAPYTWIGSTGGNWSDSSKWDVNGVVVSDLASADVVFNPGATVTATVNSVWNTTGSGNIHSLTLHSGTTTLTNGLAGTDLTIGAGGFDNSSGNAATFNFNTVTRGTLSTAGSQTWTTNSQALTFSGNLAAVSATDVLTLDSGPSNNRTILFSGAYTTPYAGTLYLKNSAGTLNTTLTFDTARAGNYDRAAKLVIDNNNTPQNVTLNFSNAANGNTVTSNIEFRNFAANNTNYLALGGLTGGGLTGYGWNNLNFTGNWSGSILGKTGGIRTSTLYLSNAGTYTLSGDNSALTVDSNDVAHGKAVFALRGGGLVANSPNALGLNNALGVCVGDYNTYTPANSSALYATPAAGTVAASVWLPANQYVNAQLVGQPGFGQIGLLPTSANTDSVIFNGNIFLETNNYQPVSARLVTSMINDASHGGTAIFNGALQDTGTSYPVAPSTANQVVLIHGAGTVQLNGANSYVCKTVIRGGTLLLGSDAPSVIPVIVTNSPAATTGATTLTLTSVTGLTVGMPVANAVQNIAPGTRITAINSGTNQITLSLPTAGAVANNAKLQAGGGALGAASSTVSLGDAVPLLVTVKAATFGNNYPANGTWSAGDGLTTVTKWTFVTVAQASTLDSQALVSGDTVLVKDCNIDVNRNGVYVVNTAAKTWTRVATLDSRAEIIANLGMRVHVTHGTQNANKDFYLQPAVATPVNWTIDKAYNTLVNEFGPQSFFADVTNPDVAMLANGAYTVARNIDVTNNQSVGKSILGGNSAHSSTFSGLVSLYKNLTLTAASGGSVDFPGDITGAYGVTKEGTGAVVWSAAKSYTGATAVTAGTLEVDSALATSAVTVGGGATLQGCGTISNGVTAAGTLAPGNSAIGTLSVGTATFSAGGVLAIRADGAAAGSADRLSVTGGLNLTNAALNLNVLTTLNDPVYVVASYGSLTGAFASVTGLPAGYTINYSYAGGTQIALVAAASDYDTWATSIGAGFTNTAAGADPDGDGLSNQQEYAFGLNPTLGSSVNPITVPFNKGTRQFTYTRRTQSLSPLVYTYQFSTSLGGWTDFTPDSATSNSGSPVEAITVTVPASLTGGAKVFVRVVAQ